MLNKEIGFGYITNCDRIDAKKATVNRFSAYSESLVMVTLSCVQ